MKSILVIAFLASNLLMVLAFAGTPAPERQATKTNRIAMEVAGCTDVEFYKYFDQNRVHKFLPVVSCEETITSTERFVRTQGSGFFKKNIYETVPGSEKATYRVVGDRREFDSNLALDDFNGHVPQGEIIRRITVDCENQQQELMVEAAQSRSKVKCQ